MQSWSTKWLGIPYYEAHCLQLVLRVLREEFNVHKPSPAEQQHAQISARMFAALPDYARRTADNEELRDGWVVLCRPGAEVMHVGLLVMDLPEPHILHTTTGHGASVLQKLRVVRRTMKIEGYYDAFD